MIESLFRSLAPWQLLGLFLVAQSTLVAGLAWLIHVCLYRSPERQHFVWLSAVLAMTVALPIQMLGIGLHFPGLQLELEPSTASEANTSSTDAATGAPWAAPTSCANGAWVS